ncbi:dienelactone hydrolase family protein [Salinarimonas ramus]|uniref:Carboxymethylenebutenolidase n=1 Tax=Salinarimonas ramus TaxID=690164 RepID=A0A917Q4L2_9HYPH|nr:dienelactone hydrolase family protein [Salinarimonas ramus]GGK21054.1 carboxymethylenebutenolidase [Salinarimonas ramus]
MDQRIIELYDAFTHGRMSRRAFLDRLATLAGGAAAASALVSVLANDYAKAQTIAEDDSRIAAETVEIPGPDGLSAYLVRPAGGDAHPAVIVIHENRGLNPHIRDVARRYAAEGFLTLAPDYLSVLGGTPEDEDRAREMIGELTGEQALAISRAALAFLKEHSASTGRVGAIGYCWGGGLVNALAVAEPTLDAGVAYYGRQPPADAVASIEAPLLLHYAGRDERINSGIPAFVEALEGAGKRYELHMYDGVNHAFNNDTNVARYDAEAAAVAFARTLAFLKQHLQQRA